VKVLLWLLEVEYWIGALKEPSGEEYSASSLLDDLRSKLTDLMRPKKCNLVFERADLVGPSWWRGFTKSQRNTIVEFTFIRYIDTRTRREIDTKKSFHEVQSHVRYLPKFLCFHIFHGNPKKFHRVQSFVLKRGIINFPTELKTSKIPICFLWSRGGLKEEYFSLKTISRTPGQNFLFHFGGYS
jgi:hypothetical protein